MKLIKTTKRTEVMTISIIVEMYYDNLSVQNYFMAKNKSYKKQMQILTESEKYLEENLSDEELMNFRKFSESWNFVNNETNKEYFCYGFKIGALIMHEIVTGRITD
jgi:hypothetical protein